MFSCLFFWCFVRYFFMLNIELFWMTWENYYTGKTTQRIGGSERKSRIWKELNEAPLAQIAVKNSANYK